MSSMLLFTELFEIPMELNTKPNLLKLPIDCQLNYKLSMASVESLVMEM